jgi:predicted Fe-Mo cluster-binding NifX family protein
MRGEFKMKIAVSATADKIDSTVDPRFGRCAYFIIVDAEGSEIKGSEAVQNTGTQAMGGAGVTAAQIVANKGVDAVITGNVGPNAFGALSQAGIKIVTGVGGVSVKDAVQRYLKGELKETTQPTNPGFGPRMGRGGGRGMGLGRGRNQ